MKTMTCKQMGGPCDQAFTGSTADEIMQKGAEHVKQLAATGDAGHIEAQKMMDDSAKNPEMMKQWMDKFHADFEALPEQ